MRYFAVACGIVLTAVITISLLEPDCADAFGRRRRGAIFHPHFPGHCPPTYVLPDTQCPPFFGWPQRKMGYADEVSLIDMHGNYDKDQFGFEIFYTPTAGTSPTVLAGSKLVKIRSTVTHMLDGITNYEIKAKLYLTSPPEPTIYHPPSGDNSVFLLDQECSISIGNTKQCKSAYQPLPGGHNDGDTVYVVVWAHYKVSNESRFHRKLSYFTVDYHE